MLVEASLDFPEEDIDFVTQADVAGQLRTIQQEIYLLCAKKWLRGIYFLHT